MSNKEPYFIDTHTHLNYEYPFPLEEYFRLAAEQDIRGFVTIGVETPHFETLKELARKYPNVYYTVGIHPHEAATFDEGTIAIMRTHLDAPESRCIAIGEIGLDYFYENASKDAQQKAFNRQLELSLELGKPICVHARDAEDDLLVALHAFTSSWHVKYPNKAPGLIHCFSGTDHFGQKCLEMGFYLSFSGIITFKTAEKLRAFCKNTVPVNRILLETDAPYLAPMPYRGKPNHSAYMIETAKVIADLKNITLDELKAIAFKNSAKAYHTDF